MDVIMSELDIFNIYITEIIFIISCLT
jgi:hypothetical protein